MLVITNCKLINVATREILPWNVWVEGERVVYIGPEMPEANPGQLIDAQGQYVCPGLISAHDHYEMSLMSAVPWSEAVLPHGTTAAILDCHDIVNVMGIEGLRLMIGESKLTPLRAFFTIPPCVPPSPALETAGCEVRLPDVTKASRFQRIVGIAEAMDFLRVVRGDPEMMQILEWSRQKGYLVDGHCPELRGVDLCRYIAAGPRTDHESTSVEEQLEKLRLGMYVILRRGSIQEPMSARDLVSRLSDTSGLLLAVDGCANVEDILLHGHMSWAVRQLITEGVHPLVAIQMATINVARAYRLDHQIGLLAPGRLADLLLVPDLRQFRPSRVMIGGQFADSNPEFPRYPYPVEALRTINLEAVQPEDFQIRAPVADGQVKIRVIRVEDGSLLTTEEFEALQVEGGLVTADTQRDLLKVAVIERYGGGTRAIGFVRGFGLKTGAFAGSIGQDSQNIVVVGVDDSDMALAVNRIRELQGGVVVVAGGRILAELALPIAGIMTDISPQELVRKRAAIKTILRSLGCQLNDPVFSLSLCITLIVIPALKMSNRGLINVTEGVVVPLFV